MKTLAIITPVYNTEDYLEEFIESIVNQKGVDFDIYMVDDGSSDRSFEILQRYAKIDSRFHIFRKSNGGVSSARNLALNMIKASKQEYNYIYFCDSDDWLEEGVLEKVIAAMKKNIADYGIFSVRKVFKDRAIAPKMNITNHQLLCHEDILKQYFRYTFKWRKEPCSEAFLNNKIFNAELVLDKRFDETLQRSEDFVFFIQVLKGLHRGILIPDAWFNYRMRKTSLTHCGYKSGDFKACLSLLEKHTNIPNLEAKLLQHKFWRAAYLEICSGADLEDIYKEVRKIPIRIPFLLSDIKLFILLFILPTSLVKAFVKFRYIIKKNEKANECFFE